MDSCKKNDPGETLEIFNDYFVKIGESIAKKAKTMNDNADFKTFLNNSVFQSIALELHLPKNFLNMINLSNVKKVDGCDNISSFFLHIGGGILEPILSLYFGHAFELGLFPKISKVRK